MAKSTKLIEITGEVQHETNHAWLFYNGKTKAWIPKSIGDWYEDDEDLTELECNCTD